MANELQKALPRAQDFLRYYRSRIEGAAAEGKVTGDANADQKVLLLFAVYQALSAPPGTPAQEEYTEAHFSAEAPILKPRAIVRPPLQRPPPAPRPESPLLQAKRGDVFMMPKQAQNMFMGFSQTKEGKDKKPVHVIINEPMLRMIDWVGVYGSLLDLVRRAMLAFKRENGHAAQDWDQVHEGWIALFEPQVMNGTMKDIPQMWLDLCPIDETPKSWAARYRVLREDEGGAAIKDTVLWAKDYAARGLTYAGALARRGFDPAEPAHKSLGVSTKPGEDLFVRRGGTEEESDTIQALRSLLKDTAKELQKTAADAGEAKHAEHWKGIATQDFTALGQEPITSSLISLSLRPLQRAHLLTDEQAQQLSGALLETAADGKQRFRGTISVPHELFKAYVAALMQLRLQTKELRAPQYPTAPTSRSVQLIRATAADDTHEPADSFIGISLDREDMRKLLLTLVDKKREALSVQIATALKADKSRTAPS